MSKKFEFYMFNPYWPKVEPIKKHVPQWYKKAERFIGGKVRLNPKTSITFKMCVPFLDSITSGYSIPLVSDILVEQTPDGPHVSWRNPSFDILVVRDGAESAELPTPTGASEIRFAWIIPCNMKVPKGYSLLVTHPFNRFDLPFQTLTGIVDANFSLHSGRLPVFFNTTFEGIIPKGTPIAQLVPIKRDSWVAVENSELKQEAEAVQHAVSSKIYGWYRENRWVKKDYS